MLAGTLNHSLIAPSSFFFCHVGTVPRRERDIQSCYYVINPNGDLKRTERKFSEWFAGEGWQGVVGKPPPTDELSRELQEKDVYM